MTELTDAHFHLHSENKARKHEKKKMTNMNNFFDNHNKVMIVDGDLVIYKIASSLEEPIDWGNDIWTLHSDLSVGKQLFKQNMEHYKQYTKSKEIIVAFSDKKNYRKELDTEYKSYRKKIRKPVCYQPLRKWVEQNYNFYCLPNLEGDDVIGILATQHYNTNNVIISGDKDMRTIPSWHCFIGDDQLEFVDENKANYNFCLQVLTGDSADGYKGCVGVGAVKANRVLHNKKTLDEMWNAVIEEYERNNQSFEDAYHQAKLARILRKDEYDFATNQPKLWNYKYEHYRDTRANAKAS
jgi:DNA polymerase-1